MNFVQHHIYNYHANHDERGLAALAVENDIHKNSSNHQSQFLSTHSQMGNFMDYQALFLNYITYKINVTRKQMQGKQTNSYNCPKRSRVYSGQAYPPSVVPVTDNNLKYT